MNRTSSLGVQAFSLTTSLIVNGGVFAAILLAATQKEPPPPPPEYVMATMVELPKLGDKPPEPKALPRIVEAPEPDVETDTASISREVEEQLEREKKKKKERERQLAEKKRRLEEKKKKLKELKKKREEERKKKIRRRMLAALNKIKDSRADEEDAPGFKQGHELGRSTDPNTLRNQLVYLDLVSRIIQRQFRPPAGIAKDIRAGLKTQVHFKINRRGQVVGQTRILQSSNNRFFDEAAVRAIKKFGAGSSLKLPLPKDRKLRAKVLRDGLSPRLKGQ